MKNGAPAVVSSAPWSQSTIDERIARGCHQSALSEVPFLESEFLEFAKKGFWLIIPADEIKHEPGLRVSPLGCVPQDGRRPRLISDYSYYDINADSQKLAPAAAMQFGQCPLRLREAIARANPKYGRVFMYKIDLSDGFYRVRLSSSASLKLAVVLPKMAGIDEQLLAIPLVLPMGWTESPPYFCAFTETIADLANIDLQRNARVPQHHLHDQAAITDFEVVADGTARAVTKSFEPLLLRRPLRKVDIFVDDFLGVAQADPSNPLANQRAVLSHNIDKMFRSNLPTDDPIRQEPISEKKLSRGDASWHTMKEALGWTWGTQSKTLRVTAKRLTKALTLLDDILGHNRVSIKRWQTLVGVLRSLQPGMSGSDGYFSLLQEALMRPVGGRIRLTSALKEQLHLFRDLLLGHESRPTELEELVPGVDINIGACDAAKPGRGGVWFLHDGRAVVWREPYPQKVQDQVVSLSNPNGSLTNSDLELEGTILQHFVLGKITPVAGETSYTGCDNTPAVMWRQKGSSTTQRTRARLLRLASGLRRHQRAHHRIGHLAGTDNQMADDASQPLLVPAPATLRRELLDDLTSIGQDIQRGVCPQRVAKVDAVWSVWTKFCSTYNWPPDLTGIPDPVPAILLFGKKWRDGTIAPRRKSVRARTAEDAMRQVGQAFSLLGKLDPRHSRHAPAQLDFRYSRLISFWKNQDPGAKRRRPLPRALLRKATEFSSRNDASPANKALNRLMWLGFFFLLRPGEYLHKPTALHPFRLQQVFLRIGDVEYRGDTIPLHLLQSSHLTFAGLQFDKQKNGVPDEKIGLGTSQSEPNPVLILARLVLHLRQFPATTGATPIYTYYDEYGAARSVSDRLMTKYLRTFTISIPVEQPPSVSALRCSGATALMEGNIPPGLIKLLGRWRSDEVFRYLHTQSEPLMQQLTDVLCDHIGYPPTAP